MQNYLFHLRDGSDVLIDPDGRELPSLDAVGAAALYEARAIISADALGGKINLAQQIEVEDESGLIVHRLDLRDAVSIQQ